MDIAGVIFDLDGLLVDSETVWNDARLAMARERGVSWTDEDHQAVMGVSTNEWVTYMAERLRLEDVSHEEIESAVVDRVAATYRVEIPFKPGAVEIVRVAATYGPTGLASGSVRRLIDAVTSHPRLAGQFSAVVSADEVELGKPHPHVYLEAARQLGVSPERCACLEDSANGILAGKAAGMYVVAVPDPRYLPRQDALSKADRVVSSLSEARDLLFV